MQILKLKNFSFLMILCASLFIVASCGEEDEEPPADPTACETEGLTYDNWAKEFITTSCGDSNCHSSTASDNGTFGMFDYESTKTAVGFDRIIGAINRDGGFSPMPKGQGKLSDCNIDKMEAWIADGAPES